VNIKKYLVIAVMCVFVGSIVIAQEANQAAPELTDAQKNDLIKEFSRSAKIDGIVLNFILLNNKTVGVLFAGDNMYSMRARANSTTMFYVLGVSGADVQLKPRFVVEQDGKKIPGEALNIKNFQPGSVSRGTKITGLIQLGEKINVTHPFKIKGGYDGEADFKLSPTAIKLLEN
jgi:hypothetical protein